jgi:S-DNA-T family DNA segregation ATPase FtsK/SpoIIIE
MISASRQTAREVTALCLLFLALLFLLSLVTYQSGDPTILTSSASHGPVRNLVGIVGANLAGFLLVGLGVGAYWLPVFFMVGALRLLLRRPVSYRLLVAVGGILLVLATCGLAALNHPSMRLWGEPLPGSGGMVGLFLKSLLLHYLNPVGAQLTLWLVLAVSLLIVTPLSLAQVGGLSSSILQRLSRSFQNVFEWREHKQKRRPPQAGHVPSIVKAEPEARTRPPESQQEQFSFMQAEGKFRLPDVSLLDKLDESVTGPDQESLLMNSRILEKKLADFGVP